MRENNILDLVLVADPDVIRDCEVEEKLNGYDHHLTHFSVSTEQELTKIKTILRDYRKADFNRALELLHLMDKPQLNSTSN